jgi:putative isomerase
MTLRHAGTELDLCYEKRGPFDVVGQWKARKLGEWGLRFWMVLTLSSEDGVPWTYDAATETLLAAFGYRHVAIKGSQPPLLVTAHETLEEIAAEYETHGYWHLASRAESGRVVALRYHLEEMPELRFAVAIRDAADEARQRASQLLCAEVAPIPAVGASSTQHPATEALDAIRDVLAWNTVYDTINRRPYVSISRNWNQAKFGGFGIWLNDQQYGAYLAGLLDGDLERENQLVALSGATPDGNLPCLLTADDAWVDRNQLPIGSFLLWLGYLRGHSRASLEVAFPTLLANHDWWWRRRDAKKCGMLSFGNSPVGTGLYRGTSIGARDESSMDNSPMHDGAGLDKESGVLGQWDVGLTSLIALDAEMLAAIAAELGERETEERLRSEAGSLKARIESVFWDDERGIFANKQWSGSFAKSVTPTSFWPLLCGAASDAQAQRLLEHLKDPSSFGGTWVLPSVSRNDPSYHDNVYWRGRVWPPLNWTVWQGLRRYGFVEEARLLALKSWELFARAWRSDRHCAENYNAETGAVLDQPDTEGFYTWGALMPAMAVSEVTDIDPWRGWTLRNDGNDLRLGPVVTPIGRSHIIIEKGRLSLRRGSRTILETTLLGQFSDLRMDRYGFAAMLPAGSTSGARLDLPFVRPSQIITAQQQGRPLSVMDAGDYARLALQATGAEPERLFIALSEWSPM